jgi:hypothetical protein
VAIDLPADLVLAPVEGEARTLEQWLTTFHLASVVIDPYTNESAWVLDAAAKVLRHYNGAARVSFLVTADADGAKAFLGPLADEFLVLTDPDRTFVKAVGLERLPAFVFVRQDRTVQGIAQGWDPPAWKAVCETISSTTAWTRPTVPSAGDPSPFLGSPALV